MALSSAVASIYLQRGCNADCNAAEIEQPELGRLRAALQVLQVALHGPLQDATRCNGFIPLPPQTPLTPRVLYPPIVPPLAAETGFSWGSAPNPGRENSSMNDAANCGESPAAHSPLLKSRLCQSGWELRWLGTRYGNHAALNRWEVGA